MTPQTLHNHFGNKHGGATGKDEWITPPGIIKALGKFDLDPCAPSKRRFETARHYFTKKENGLLQNWKGRVWLNPPYGSQTKLWLEKLCEHGNGIALIFARTETKAFFDYVWKHADAIFFIKNRLRFLDVKAFPFARIAKIRDSKQFFKFDFFPPSAILLLIWSFDFGEIIRRIRK
jgi:hypothetical protein